MSPSEGSAQDASFGDLLRGHRMAASLTQEELAERAGLSSKTIGNLERGQGQPYLRSIRLLANALNLTGPARQQFSTQALRTQPGTLPRDTPGFTGREAELARLTAAASASGRAVGIQAIGGMAGVGKTALAVHAAHQLASRFPDGQLFVPLQGHTPGQRPVDPAGALASLLVTAGVSPARIPSGLPERAALWRDHLAGQRLLLVLDDAASSGQVEPLLPGTAGSLVLVTSRRHLTGLQDADVINLDVLTPEEAALLLVWVAGRPELDAGDTAVTTICALCGYLPLAVGMLASQLHHHPAWTAAGLAADLAVARDRLELMAGENVSVAAWFDVSYADLDDDQQRLFRRLALHPGPDIDRYAVAALDDCTLAAARHRLAALYDNHLLTEPATGRYRLHDLLREHARGLAARVDPAAAREAVLSRLLDYYITAATRAQATLTRRTSPAPGPPGYRAELPDLADGTRALAWARAERANLLACLDLVRRAGQQDRVVALTNLAAIQQLTGAFPPWGRGIARGVQTSPVRKKRG